jgi:hypothetical protein
MQADNNKRKIPTSAEIVDVPPSGSPSTSSEISLHQKMILYLQVQQN